MNDVHFMQKGPRLT